jgi:hypothetical protein
MVKLLIATMVQGDGKIAKHAQECLDHFDILRAERQVEAAVLEREVAAPTIVAKDLLRRARVADEKTVATDTASIDIKKAEDLKVEGYLEDKQRVSSSAVGSEPSGESMETKNAQHLVDKTSMAARDQEMVGPEVDHVDDGKNETRL